MVLSGQINDDFKKAVAVDVASLAWVPSPAPGVFRKPLDRVGLEVARATSIVKFEAGYSFDAHTHGGGEEYLVLEGVFSDEAGDHDAMTYVRNPPGTSHKPHSANGCVIFVKLHQMRPSGEVSMTARADDIEWQKVRAVDGLFEKQLFHADGWVEEVSLFKAAPDSGRITLSFPDGGEILVLKGALFAPVTSHSHEETFLPESEDALCFKSPSWLRFPKGSTQTFEAPDGATFWMKKGIDFPL